MLRQGQQKVVTQKLWYYANLKPWGRGNLNMYKIVGREKERRKEGWEEEDFIWPSK